MKKTGITIIAFLLVYATHAQTPEDSVKMVVNKMFAAMKSSDMTALQECFADSAILQTINRTGNVQTENLAGFVKQIGALPKDAADERIHFDMVKVDDALAVAWTPYRFYYNGKFSHCGVNSFQLVRVSGVWKIQYLIDTRRRDGCDH